MLDRFLDELVITNQDAIPEVKNRQKPKLNKFKSTGKSVPVVTELFSRILIYLRDAIRLRTSVVEPIHLNRLWVSAAGSGTGKNKISSQLLIKQNK